MTEWRQAAADVGVVFGDRQHFRRPVRARRMIWTNRRVRRLVTATAAGLLLSGASCQGEEPADPDERGTADVPPERIDAATVPDADVFLPPLAGYRVDDEVDAGEIRASLDGAVPYVETRRRLILDEQGFTAGDVMVVTFPPGADGPERFLRHWFGDAAGTPVSVQGVEMLRIPTEAHDVLAWRGPTFIVVFGRGQETTDEWLEALAAATVRAVAARSAETPG